MPPEAKKLASSIYFGTVQHRRRGPVRHEFRYRIALLLLDLDELPRLQKLAPLWGSDKRALLSFRRQDHFGDSSVALDRTVRDLVLQRCGLRLSGPIRLLTSPRLLGYSFNPISLFFCYDEAGEALECIVAEVTNTPWLERHCYVLPVAAKDRRKHVQHFVTQKELHVSPFMGMKQQYHWTIGLPDDALSVQIENRAEGQTVFDAQLVLRRRVLNRRNLLRSIVEPPLGAFRVQALIHFEALRLWRKGLPYQPHPQYNGDRQALAGCPEEGKHEEQRLAG